MSINFNYIMQRPDPVILDIGTYDGEQCIEFLQAYPQAKLYAFEADPEVWPIFKSNLKSKIGYPHPQVELIKSAVGNINGELTWYHSIDTLHDNIAGPSGTFLKPTQHIVMHPHVEFRKKQINCMTLDSWFDTKKDEIDIIDFAWTDVNGAEKAMIEGGKNTFDKHTRYLLLECLQHQLWENQIQERELLALLPNFSYIMRDQSNILLRNTLID